MNKPEEIDTSLETGATYSTSFGGSSEGLGEFAGLVYVQYVDHVVFHRAIAEEMIPQIRETVGWLSSETDLYITICYDRDTAPPTLKGGDAKASGLVLLKSAILAIKRFCEQTRKFKIIPHHINATQIRAHMSKKFGVSNNNKQETVI